MSTTQRFKLATQAAFAGTRDGVLVAPSPAGMRAPVLPTRQASFQLELPLAMPAMRPRHSLRTG